MFHYPPFRLKYNRANGDLTNYINEGNVFVIPFCIDDNGVVVMRFSTHSKRTFESIHKPDDDQSCDKILPSFEPDMFESIHKPDDEQSSDEILHPFKPGSLLC